MLKSSVLMSYRLIKNAPKLRNRFGVCRLCTKPPANGSGPVQNPTAPDKYQQFRDEDLTILDVEEERWKIREEESSEVEEKEVKYIRGKHGVFDIEELVELLRENKGANVFVARIPESLQYADYIVIVSANSVRHILALGETVRRRFKHKRNTTDPIPKLEGESSDWVALDLGNIILHVMSHQTRELYDLESLWGIGPIYDKLTNQAEDSITELMKLHSISLDDLVPRNTP